MSRILEDLGPAWKINRRDSAPTGHPVEKLVYDCLRAWDSGQLTELGRIRAQLNEGGERLPIAGLTLNAIDDQLGSMSDPTDKAQLLNETLELIELSFQNTHAYAAGVPQDNIGLTLVFCDLQDYMEFYLAVKERYHAARFFARAIAKAATRTDNTGGSWPGITREQETRLWRVLDKFGAKKENGYVILPDDYGAIFFALSLIKAHTKPETLAILRGADGKVFTKDQAIDNASGFQKSRTNNMREGKKEELAWIRETMTSKPEKNTGKVGKSL
jgi:hypothetical protein